MDWIGDGEAGWMMVGGRCFVGEYICVGVDVMESMWMRMGRKGFEMCMICFL